MLYCLFLIFSSSSFIRLVRILVQHNTTHILLHNLHLHPRLQSPLRYIPFQIFFLSLFSTCSVTRIVTHPLPPPPPCFLLYRFLFCNYLSITSTFRYVYFSYRIAQSAFLFENQIHQWSSFKTSWLLTIWPFSQPLGRVFLFSNTRLYRTLEIKRFHSI